MTDAVDVLEADPTTATAVAAVQSDVDQNEADSDAADAALSGRLDVLEADPTTATAVAAVQGDVDQNEADADAALALKWTLRLEADPDFTGQLEVERQPSAWSTTQTSPRSTTSCVERQSTDRQQHPDEACHCRWTCGNCWLSQRSTLPS